MHSRVKTTWPARRSGCREHDRSDEHGSRQMSGTREVLRREANGTRYHRNNALATTRASSSAPIIPRGRWPCRSAIPSSARPGSPRPRSASCGPSSSTVRSDAISPSSWRCRLPAARSSGGVWRAGRRQEFQIAESGDCPMADCQSVNGGLDNCTSRRYNIFGIFGAR